MAQKLTPRQQQILQLICTTIQQIGRPPTRVEIAKHFGFKSPNAAEDHLRALQRKGYIRLLAGTSRGIQPTQLAGLPLQPGMLGQESTAIVGPHGHSYSQIMADEVFKLPLIGRVAAGAPILAAEHVEKQIPINPQMFANRPDYFLKVRGSSMQDAGILDGDLLAVQSNRHARSGQIVVARLADEVTVKRLELKGKNISLLPENPDFAPIKIGPGDDFCIEGIAVGLIRGMS